MDIIYRAYDGKEFDKSNDCHNYELKKQLEEMDIIALNKDKKPVNIFLRYDDCYFLKLNSLENYQKIQNFFDNEGLILLPDPHTLNTEYKFYYNDRYTEWIDVYQRKLELEKELQDLEF